MAASEPPSFVVFWLVSQRCSLWVASSTISTTFSWMDSPRSDSFSTVELERLCSWLLIWLSLRSLFWWRRRWWWEWSRDCTCLLLGEAIRWSTDRRLETVDELELLVDLWTITFTSRYAWALVASVSSTTPSYLTNGTISFRCACLMRETPLATWAKDPFILSPGDSLFCTLLVLSLKRWWDLRPAVDRPGWARGWLMLPSSLDVLRCRSKFFKNRKQEKTTTLTVILWRKEKVTTLNTPFPWLLVGFFRTCREGTPKLTELGVELGVKCIPKQLV